ncbi:hypothetical protein BOTBODRAFT_28926 [Botryobasidium botryosum FD-172 SS1]|uniref:Uncharacterized protein n=1 Tax=Botryobasidium botryosum (strain FD-172 SS1) TaxID=930990 RepID=A0A067MSF6_BOTB1|nr:hypothetical protein BOTBODRAFT_28926 [Botryobasidium botryosum FD-172 SS1]
MTATPMSPHLSARVRAWFLRILFFSAACYLYRYYAHWPHELPRYDSIASAERALPQHNLSLPFPEGQDGRYVRFSTQTAELGYNNILQEILLLSHLAYLSNRAYVFRPFQWAMAHTPFHVQGERRAPRVPLSALLGGPVTGDPWGPGETAPRAITDEWWEVVCPPERRVQVDAVAIKHRFNDTKADGLTLMRKWAKLLGDTQASCVEIVPGSGGSADVTQTFDFWLFGDPRILTLWPSLFKSPAITRLYAPQPVRAALTRNSRLLAGGPVIEVDNHIPGLIGLHLRRGDYETHCKHLFKYNSTFEAWNMLPGLRAEPRPKGVSDEEWHARRCWPTIDQIAERMATVKKAYPGLERVFLLTNGDKAWVAKLKQVLRSAGWKAVVSSLDLDLSYQEIGLGPAIDMEIARRADVFIGNGWSSLSSNVILFRLTSGKTPQSTSTW